MSTHGFSEATERALLLEVAAAKLGINPGQMESFTPQHCDQIMKHIEDTVTPSVFVISKAINNLPLAWDTYMGNKDNTLGLYKQCMSPSDRAVYDGLADTLKKDLELIQQMGHLSFKALTADSPSTQPPCSPRVSAEITKIPDLDHDPYTQGEAPLVDSDDDDGSLAATTATLRTQTRPPPVHHFPVPTAPPRRWTGNS